MDGQMEETEEKQQNGTNGQMGQMEDKWRTNGRTNGGNMEKAQIWREWDKWESVCLNIRSHLSHRLMPRIGEPSGNK